MLAKPAFHSLSAHSATLCVIAHCHEILLAQVDVADLSSSRSGLVILALARGSTKRAALATIHEGPHLPIRSMVHK